MSLSTILLCALGCALASRAVVAEPLKPKIAARNLPGTSSIDTLRAVSRGLSSFRLHGRDTVLRNTTTLDKSWDGAVLFQFENEVDASSTNGSLSVGGSVEIVCRTCYIKGNATAELSIAAKFNASQAFQNLTADTSLVADKVKNITETAIHATEDYFENLLKNITSGSFELSDLDDFDFPTLDSDFNVAAIPDIPEVKLRFQFDDMELYMALDANLDLDATYTLNLYKSETPIGLGAGQNLDVGVIVDIDLILSVDAQLDISSGFHIKLNDGAAIEIAMFGKNVSNVAFNGGQFEFLPVTVESAGAVMTAVLQVSLHAGIQVSEPGFQLPGLLEAFSVPSTSAGMEVGVFAHLANFVTNITASSAGDDEGYNLKVVEYYELALGAAAGATLAIGSQTWGPNPQTTVPVFFTTLGANCATQKTASPTQTANGTTATVAPRQATSLTTTTISTTVTYSNVGCMTTGLVNCPVSLQTTSKFTTTSTLVMSVPSGVSATFPVTTHATVPSTVAFGTKAQNLISSSGAPVSFVPPPPPPTSTSTSASTPTATSTSNSTLTDIIQGDTAGVPNAAIIGASVGGGIALLIALFFGYRYWRHKQYALVESPTVRYGQYEPPQRQPKKQSVTVTVA